MILVIDNYDSFTYNIVSHYQGQKLNVVRNDEISVDEALDTNPSLIVISPGPKTPDEAGICLELIQRVAAMANPIAIFGICLGAQALARAFGASIVRARLLFHGKVSKITHDGQGVFTGIKSPMIQARYHSLVADENTLDADFVVSAKSDDGEVMGIRHRSLPFEGVQFHPESIASAGGTAILDNARKLSAAGELQKNVTKKEEINVFNEYMEELLQGRSLSLDQARKMMDIISSAALCAEEVAMFLTAMRVKKESSQEIAGIALSAREHAVKLPLKNRYPELCDIVGTGGDRSGTFNISTAAGIVAAGAGARVAKHGNRAVSSRCGSADVLEALGVNIQCSKEQVLSMLEEAGMGFLFAPLYHPAMKHVAPVRKALKIRTLFNILGPLINPAQVPVILLGVYSREIMDWMADILVEMNITRAMVLHSHNATDEISAQHYTELIEIKEAKKQQFTLDPSHYGFSYDKDRHYSELQGRDAAQNAKKILSILEGKEQGIACDTVVLNSAVLLFICGKASSIEAGVEAARDSIDSGKALRCLELMRKLSNTR